MTRKGLLKALELAPGPECHALHARLGEILAFLPGAIEGADDQLAQSLMDLDRIVRGD